MTGLGHAGEGADPFEIAILTGSGPEAGIDLWHAVLAENRRRRGRAFRGDLDAPSVLVRSDPRLGLSMDLARHRAELCEIVLDHARVLDDASRSWTIACNTLNAFAPDIRSAGFGERFVSFPDAVERWLDGEAAHHRVALLGARPVAELGPDSPYHHLTDAVVAAPADVVADTHELILDIKRVGPPYEDQTAMLGWICGRVEADRFLLACTELPLVARPEDPRMVDVTRLVAAALLDRSSDR